MGEYSVREFPESPDEIGQNERIAYELTTTIWGSGPTDVAVTFYDTTDPNNWVDVSSTNLTGSASIAGDVITTPLVINCVAFHDYILFVKFDADGNTFEPYGVIYGRR